MTKKEFIAELNEDLKLEFKSIVMYINQIARLKGAKYQQTIAELKAHLDQETSHAIIVGQQIDFLGGEPTTELPAMESVEDSREALKDDLKLEEKQLERYRNRVVQAEELGFPDVAEALAPVLEETQHHVRDLRSVLAA